MDWTAESQRLLDECGMGLSSEQYIASLRLALSTLLREKAEAERERALSIEEVNRLGEDNATLRAQLAAVRAKLEQIGRHCPCGARPESPATHPHVGGCPVYEALALVVRRPASARR